MPANASRSLHTIQPPMAPSRPDLTIALTSSDSPSVDQVRFRPLTGDSRDRSSVKALVEKMKPPSSAEPAIAAPAISSSIGTIATSASVAKAPSRSPMASVSKASRRVRSRLPFSETVVCATHCAPIAEKPTPLASSARNVTSSRERAT